MKILLFLLLYILKTTKASDTHDLTIKITGVTQIQGNVQVGIYNDPKRFPKVGETYRVEYVKVTAKEVTCQVKELPEGDYAIAIYHDVNSNQVCNLNFLGIPTEPYAFSNNVKPLFSAPSFEAAKIPVYKDSQISVALIH